MNYQNVVKKIESYKEKFDVKIIGKTEFNRNVYAVEKNVKTDFFTAVFVAAIHAREFVTTDLLCRMIDDGLFDEVLDFNLSFILMANPDGVELVKSGIDSVPQEMKEYVLKLNNKLNDFSMWKANGKGIDLNNNFDANFGNNMHALKPSAHGWAGEFAESEKESKAIADYIRSKKVFFVASYHSKGEEIYFNFFQENERLKRDEKIASRFAESTGYLIRNVESVSSGGLKDYCVQKLKIPSITVEVGDDDLVHPIDEKFLEMIYSKHKNVAKDLNFAYNVFIKSRR